MLFLAVVSFDLFSSFSLNDIYNAILKCFIVSREIVIESLFDFEDFYGCLLLVLY